MCEPDRKNCALTPNYAIGIANIKFNAAPRPEYGSVQTTISCLLDEEEVLGVLTPKAELVAKDAAVGLKLNLLVSLANLKRAA